MVGWRASNDLLTEETQIRQNRIELKEVENFVTRENGAFFFYSKNQPTPLKPF